MVPLGHRLIVRKTVPFGASFWKTVPFCQGALHHFVKKGTVLVPFFL